MDLIVHKNQYRMQSTLSTYIVTYAKANWFKIALASILLFVFLKKDLSFNFQIGSPNQQQEMLAPSLSKPKKKEVKKKKPEKITQKAEKEVVAPPIQKPKTSLMDFFKSTFSSKKRVDPKAELANIDDSIKEAYIKRFAHVAENEQKKFGIPASIIIANSLVHSLAGTSSYASNGNNHFNISCSRNWAGEKFEYGSKCYRKYDNAWASFRDHSIYITNGKFKYLKGLKSTDYKAWAKGLGSAQYSDIDNLSRLLIDVIESYELQHYDL